MLPLKVGRSVHGTLEGLIIANVSRMLVGLIIGTAQVLGHSVASVEEPEAPTAAVHRGARRPPYCPWARVWTVPLLHYVGC